MFDGLGPLEIVMIVFFGGFCFLWLIALFVMFLENLFDFFHNL